MVRLGWCGLDEDDDEVGKVWGVVGWRTIRVDHSDTVRLGRWDENAGEAGKAQMTMSEVGVTHAQ
jgi:hypothetical protein